MLGKMRLTKNIADNSIYRIGSIAFSQWFNVIVIYALAYNAFFMEADYKNDEWESYGTFNMMWYFAVGTPLVMTIFISIFLPHIDITMKWMRKVYKRLKDRGYKMDSKHTKQFT